MLFFSSNHFLANILKSITITQPDDWHVHLRDGAFLPHTVNAVAQQFRKALIMPNLQPPLTSIKLLEAYRERILAALNPAYAFTPYMTFYLNEQVLPQEISLCKNYPYIVGGKLYPAGVTTNSNWGVKTLEKLYPVFSAMQEQNLVLQVHGESREGDIFEREERFIEESFIDLAHNFPRLRIVFEHISTKKAVDFVMAAPDTIAATITPHHLLYNRNHLLAQGLKPHYYCLPILKHVEDQMALQAAVFTGNRKFFAGTDSAPHLRKYKENACGCAGIYSSPYALALYTQLFAKADQLSKLNNFMSEFGALFYQKPKNKEKIRLIEKPSRVPSTLLFGEEEVIPIAAGELLCWSIDESVK